MTDREFCANILAKVLIDAGAGIIVGGTDSDEIIKHMAETECCEALRKIREILDDDTFNDEACFYRISRIVRLYEELGPGGRKPPRFRLSLSFPELPKIFFIFHEKQRKSS